MSLLHLPIIKDDEERGLKSCCPLMFLKIFTSSHFVHMISIKSSTKELKVLQISCFCRYCIFHIIRETSERYPGFPPLIVSPAKQTSTSPDLSFCYFQFYLLSSEKNKNAPTQICPVAYSYFKSHRRLHLIPVSFNMIKIIDILWQPSNTRVYL